MRGKPWVKEPATKTSLNKSLYDWIKVFKQRDEECDLRAQNARLRRELKRAQEEMDILKNATRS